MTISTDKAAALAAIARDRLELRRRWRALGHYADKTVSQRLAEGVEQAPDVMSHFYLGSDHRAVDNRTMRRQSLALAAGLAARGLGAGDVIALQLPTLYETALFYQAVFLIGAVALPIVHIYGPNEVGFILAQSGARALVTPTRWRKIDFAECNARYAGIASLEQIIAFHPSGGAEPSGLADLMGPAETVPPAAGSPDDVCLLMYTSGTTSAPKGVRHSHNTLIREWDRPFYADRGLYLSSLPAGHYTGFGYLMRPMLYGAPSVFMDHWDARLAAELVQRHQVAQSGGTPIFLVTLLRAAAEAGFDLASLRSFGMGGAAMSPAQIRQADEMGFHGARVYGSTEHPTVTRMDLDADFETRGHTDGFIDDGNEVRIVDDGLNDVQVGLAGEILTRGPELFVGYSDPELDLESFLPGGWYRTGDIGRLDRAGRLIITDRKKDIIIRGGENISAKEVEDLLAEHEAVAEVAVTASPDPIYGEKVCAFVVTKEGRSMTLNDIFDHFQAMGVARQKTPERLEIVPALPRTPSGKVKKFELRAWLRQAPSSGHQEGQGDERRR